MTTRHFNLSLLVLTLMSACAPQPDYMRLPVLHDPRPKFILVSWRTPVGTDAFALFSSDDDMYVFLDSFRPTAPHITSNQLRQRLQGLPRRCLLTWMADPAHHIGPPPAALRRRVEAVTKPREIDLQFNEITTEDTGI